METQIGAVTWPLTWLTPAMHPRLAHRVLHGLPLRRSDQIMSEVHSAIPTGDADPLNDELRLQFKKRTILRSARMSSAVPWGPIIIP